MAIAASIDYRQAKEDVRRRAEFSDHVLGSVVTARRAGRVQRLFGLGARRVDIGQGQAPWVVLAGPEGNELCVLEPRKDYTGAGTIAAVVLEYRDPEGLAAFWSQASARPASAEGTQFIPLQHHTMPPSRDWSSS